MNDDITPAGRTPDDAAHEPPRDAPGELQLRKALATMNDLQPPRDDLFVQRAVLRGRAATARRRSTLVGAAAAFVVVAGVGGGWYAANHGVGSNSTTAASAPEAATDSGEKAAGGSGAPAQGYGSGGGSAPPAQSSPPSVRSTRDASTWFEPPATPVTLAFEAVEPAVVSRWPDLFSGVYATDETNSHLVVALTRPDAALQSLVTGAMPSPSDVDFTTATHSFAEKDRLARQVLRDSGYWRSRGVEIHGVRQDGRADQVVVLADEGATPGVLVAHYGDLLRVVPATAAPPGKLPDATTLPTLH
jgi:hypothetical protein